MQNQIKISTWFSVLLTLLFVNQGWAQNISEGQQILEKSIRYYDPSSKWAETPLEVYLQEPRVMNPVRYSEVRLQPDQAAFSLHRNRERHVAQYLLSSSGEASILLDGSDQIDSSLIDKYRLDPDRISGYKHFYTLLSGVPMSLTESTVQAYGSMTELEYNNVPVYAINIELKEALFSKFWKVYIAQDNFRLIGIDIYFPDDPDKGERLLFGGLYKYGEVSIPRYKHWHELSNGQYMGSDIIVKSLDTE